MIEHNNAVRSKRHGNNRVSQVAHIVPLCWVSRSWIPGLLCAALTFGLSSHAGADPVANQIYSNCTFTDADLGDLEIADRAPEPPLPPLPGGQLKLHASYIIIYVRENPNDGQEIWIPGGEGGLVPTGTFTGAILCTNDDTDIATSVNENTLIPDTGPDDTVDILGAEEASHLQYVLTDGAMEDTEKRVCHTVAGNTDCFSIKPKP
jgi:hypothetical protein